MCVCINAVILCAYRKKMYSKNVFSVFGCCFLLCVHFIFCSLIFSPILQIARQAFVPMSVSCFMQSHWNMIKFYSCLLKPIHAYIIIMREIYYLCTCSMSCVFCECVQTAFCILTKYLFVIAFSFNIFIYCSPPPCRIDTGGFGANVSCHAFR